MSDVEWISVPDFADRLGVTASQVRELLREGALVSVRRGERNTVQLPAEFIMEVDGVPSIIPTLKGTLTLLGDAHLSDDATLEWLLTDDEELGMSPLAALRSGQRAHVRRIAQTLL
ncbi:Rv2175c family DNA-binding protein [Demequina sp.]|uniref:Rv2175c family DNA-binding protein n=1 Tax=Demequina sp. TaxID=2050685 RepID=UPI003D0B2B7D